MTLQVNIPNNFTQEIRWIVSVLLEDFLGLDVAYSTGSPGRLSIEADGKQFSTSLSVFPLQSDRIDEIELPCETPPLWETEEAGLSFHLRDTKVPILSGNPSAEIKEGKISLDWDLFGSAFLLLSRFEEMSISNLDEHHRIRLEDTMEGRYDLVNRPLVDEYLEILWSCLHFLWPQLKRRPHVFTMDVSCDLDHIYCPSTMNPTNLIRRIGGDILTYHSPSRALSHLKNYQATRNGDHSRDPFLNAVFTMMDINEAAGNSVTFNIKPLASHPKFDAPADLDDPTMRQLLHTIYDRGHKIGFHPGYQTYDNDENFTLEITKLRHVLAEEKIDIEVAGGRQHYLRWSTPETARLWENAGLQYDATLGFAQHAGFRCGTSRIFRMYDLKNRQPMKLVQRPLIMMEVSVIYEPYMGLGRTPAAIETMENLKETCRFHGGNFSLLWHNSLMLTPWDFATYKKLCSS